MRTKVVTIAWPNWVDSSTLSANVAFSSNLPLVNAKNRVLGRKARTSILSSPTPTVTVQCGRARVVGCIAIAAHNFGVEAQWRVKLYADAAKTTLYYDSGYLLVWPTVFGDDDLEWEDDRFWEGTVGTGENGEYTPLAVHFADDNYIPECAEIEIVDPANEAGYVEIGRIFMGQVWQPIYNLSFDSGHGLQDTTPITEALDQTEYFDVQRQRRTFTGTLNFLNEAEDAYVTRMRRTLGISGEMIFTKDLTQDFYFFERTFLCRFRESSVITHPFVKNFANVFDVLEII